ncbi:predicted protein [Naegleria gruberi]|uniref:Predicted protein n=1 Tax=Naegleria gruberi TaxID=5762 RepID=D2VES8_NAEGR|nr:uncharacterized protein NAEGRDRAFT_67379 [Naegleria gruberi]EFC44655.1 predicted protein [Naegleria gruberi]|eukprot:XP_002677399.1 predicted protein [Naegleria gruberi strain NEG-M]
MSTTLQSLPFEVIMEIINFLPSNFLISDRFLHLLTRLLLSNIDDDSGSSNDYTAFMKKRLKQDLFDEHYMFKLFTTLKSAVTYISRRNINNWIATLKFLNPDEFDHDLMLKVLIDPLRRLWPEMPRNFWSTDPKIHEIMHSNLIQIYKEMDLDWKELNFLYKFIERNSYCCLCSKTREIAEEERIRNALSSVGGQLNFEWYFCNNENYRNGHYESQIPGILKLAHLNYDLPFKVRGVLKLKDDKIVYTNLWVKKPEICLESSLTNIQGLGGKAIIKYLSKPTDFFFDNDPTMSEIASQLYILPSSCKPNKIIRANTRDIVCISDIFIQVHEPSTISTFCDSSKHLFKCRESVLGVEVDINVNKRQKECKIIPRSPLITIAPLSIMFIIALLLDHFKCFLNFRFTREFFARHNLSWTESILLVLGDITSATLIGYFAKAYYCYSQGYFLESHISLLELFGNISFIGNAIKYTSQIFNSYFTKKSKLLPIFFMKNNITNIKN